MALSDFYWMIDVAAYNASVCFMSNQPNIYQGAQRRRKILMDLSEELVLSLTQRLSHSENFRKLHKQTLSKMEFFLPEAVFQPQTATERQKKRCCKFPRDMDKKTRKKCSRYFIPICENHAIFICSDCVKNSARIVCFSAKNVCKNDCITDLRNNKSFRKGQGISLLLQRIHR